MSHRDIYDGRIRRAIVTADQSVRIEAAGQNALADFNAEIINDLNQLHILHTEVAGRENEFRGFRDLHRLSRLPNVGSRNHSLFAGMLIAVFILVESILNGMFFARGSESGLIGGVAQAFVFSILNVGVGAVYGRLLLPYIFHRGVGQKILGLAGLGAFLLWLGGLNLFIGHFRDVFIANAGDVPMKDLLDRIRIAPISFRDAQSGLLAVLGMALGGAAVIDVAVDRDLYPGYARVGRLREQAITRYAVAQGECLSALTRLRNDAVADMTDAIEMIGSSRYDLELAREGRLRLHSNYSAYLSELTHAHTRLILSYRVANRRNRKTPPPRYFDDLPSRPASLTPTPLPELKELSQDVRSEAIERIERYIRAVNERFEITLPRYRTVSELTTPASVQHVSA